MADESDEFEYQILQRKHRNENKELQAKIQSMKHSMPKGDKKKKKHVMTEIAGLEEELKQRHEKELKRCHTNIEQNDEASNSGLENKLSESHIADAVPHTSRAQKRREEKAAKEREREGRIAQAEADNIHSARNVEAEKLKTALDKKCLTIKEITPDGHCLYNAVAHQLMKQAKMHDIQSLRACAANYMLNHRDDFLPFLLHQNTGDLYTPDEFTKYCDEVATTTAWGGHLEIQALSEALKISIVIFQADSPVLRVGEKYDSTPITLSYHRHAYGLGEHYNSVVSAEGTAS